MVMTATSLGRTGLQDWLIQRLSALILSAYFGLISYKLMLIDGPVNGSFLRTCLQDPVFRYASLLSFLALIAHAWIGLWTVLTDYIRPTALRLSLQCIVMASLVLEGLWALRLVRGIG